MIKHILLLLFAFGAVASAVAEEPSKSAALTQQSMPFAHPGMMHSRAELEYIKQKIDAGEEPWKSAWERLLSSERSRNRSNRSRRRRRRSRERDSNRVGVSSLDYKPSPSAEVIRGPYNNPNIGSSEFSSDSMAAYSHALQWWLTGKEVHADKAIEILNAWSSTLESIGGHDARLLVGMGGIGYCNAAELIRHSEAKWKPEDQERFEKMLRTIFYPLIEDFFPSANGNWEASMIQTMLAMGVFLDDRAMFDRAADYCRDGEGNGAIKNYFNEFGECQESGRDQAHTQMGLGFLGCACEIAWKQGVDLYATADNRLALGFEYTAKYNLGHDVRYEPYKSFEGRYHYKELSSESRGRFSPIYERIVHHFHDRIGLDMPYSREVAEKGRPNGASTTHMPWGTLLFHGLPTGLNPIEVDRGLEGSELDTSDSKPLVLGRGVALFKIGRLLAKDDFENLDNWVIQIQERPDFPPAKVVARENSLDGLVPGRGCTAWFKQKLSTGVSITYDVICPTPDPAIEGVQPRDIIIFGWLPMSVMIRIRDCSIRSATRGISAPTTKCTGTMRVPAVGKTERLACGGTRAKWTGSLSNIWRSKTRTESLNL
jgi:hypothetical protein